MTEQTLRPDSTRSAVIAAALRLAASDWGNGRQTAAHSADLDMCEDLLDEALRAYVAAVADAAGQSGHRYLSTACMHELADGRPELHASCRATCKVCNASCACSGHPGRDADDPDAYPPMDVHGTLPWSVLRQDSPTWQTRKKHWAGMGVDDTAPRAHAASMMATGRHGSVSGGISRFDPHLAEVLYRWFCPPGGAVADPFAGGPVRGLVAGHLGHPYVGVDLLADQVEANTARAEDWQARGLLTQVPGWVHGDAAALLATFPSGTVDYVLTCPPYHNRERYSDYQTILAETVRVLADDRFATIVVSDIRDSRGHLRGLPALTTQAMTNAGAHLVNEQILVAPLGLAAKRMRPPWEACRTTTRIHQLVLTYIKGDRRDAARAAQGRAG